MGIEKPILKPSATARFDARLTTDQKKMFEEAAKIKGFKSLSEFIIQVTQEAAIEIIEQHNAILASEKDKKVFFDALINPPKPNKSLTNATVIYKRQAAKK